LLFVAQRMYTSLIVQKKFLLEDGLLLCGWLLIILITVLILRTVAQGLMGTHAYEMEISRFLEYDKEFYPMPIVYPLCMMFGKLSLLVFYLRLSPVFYFKIAAYFGMFFVFGSFFSLTFATAFPCKPIAMAWNPLIDGSCISRPATYKATAILGLLSDIYLITLPLPTIFGLQMPWQQKAGLIAMFGVGIVTIFTSIMRLVIIIKELSNADVSWGSAPTAFWLIIEAHLMIICASLPSLRKFFRHIAPKFIGERSSAAGSNPQRNNNLITFGRSNQKKKYKQFDSAYGLDTVNDVPYGLQTWHNVDVIAGGSREIREHEETSVESQMGILETRTATVSTAAVSHQQEPVED